jgi:uncharacterized protein YndB with AHSA1/START domain
MISPSGGRHTGDRQGLWSAPGLGLLDLSGSATGTGDADQGGQMSTGVGTESEAHPAGETDEPLQVRLSRVVGAPLAHVWEVLVSPAGAQALLGEGAVLGAKGEPYHCADGASGVVRSYHPLEQLRVSWHETPDSPPSVVEVDLRADGEGTVLELRHDRLVDTDQFLRVEERWKSGLAELARAAEA